MKTNTIFEYDPQIYPAKLWVAHLDDVELSYLDERFYLTMEDGVSVTSFAEHFTQHPLPQDGTVVATTIIVQDKTTYEQGMLVLVVTERKANEGTFAHEASHCTDYVLETIGVSTFSFADGEPRAYLLQWFFEKIWESAKAYKKLKKKHNG